MLACVITTIQRPTDSVRTLAKRLAGSDSHLIIAGDTKGPDSFDLSDVPEFGTHQLSFLTIDDQLASEFEIAKLLPTKHYARKNVGYLQAIRSGASSIYETDDDNAPLDSWKLRDEFVGNLRTVQAEDCDSPNWINVYRHFSGENIWPRGLPLDRIQSVGEVRKHQPGEASGLREEDGRVWAPIQQGLADGSPDVDAIWRLVLDREFTFDQADSVILPPGSWCPFNTQTTWWWPVVYPLLYVPSYCSFRMCDIWKSFVAQRCLWELETGVVFHAPEVWQERNVHDLTCDFDDEVPGYQQNNRIAQILEATTLQGGAENVGKNLKQCYKSLIDAEIFPAKEMQLIDAWLTGVADSL
ncbi:hypothetical protein FHS27_002094 [Rhodopirellula rubra]|uniref:DUF288 domain-containing protein n=1 Tax=Aporhodopirellula rubra TaxID=980271 RepID=A0A7W5DXJ9_9BACT|nr:STELLO glycosyltransferase family protein [Aporhodopirellula rubra]MBB3206285.1 hypothetical protein [Aporhodopirellula rubra]